ncbi:putative aminopeptidase W07G4.4 isoform X1 [Trichogramma pretiosum]|uniref:putative aminopeptidase W07G4.4 isoform X1 n=1 Tax=Trichogramma pretiosum TaxID=7493 RepID=UPI0006C9D708|nr:putative aminopeptidase W07G4.4 isoform X1 [Trichogramma pretiosum]XP_014221947.1 putative aminopeptidase W07G4.4 isoform X1 [Trichogramma pretiosum]
MTGGAGLAILSLVRLDARLLLATGSRGSRVLLPRTGGGGGGIPSSRSFHFRTLSQRTSPLLGDRQAHFRLSRLLRSNRFSMANDYSTYIPTDLLVETNVCSPDYDGVVLVSGKPPGQGEEPEPFKSVLYCSGQLDSGLFDCGAVLPINLPAKRLVYSPTGAINPDYDDVRVFKEAAAKGIKRALKAGVKCPLLVLLPDSRFENVELVTLLGALEALYVPLEVREISAERTHKAKRLGVWSPICATKLQGVVKLAQALESGRYVARDIGGADPERMAAPRVEEYLRQLFHGSRVSVQSICDEPTLLKEYPCLAAVNRGASVTPRHQARVIFLTYEPQDPSCVLETVMLVGKGVTYDTGGNDIKTDGHMAGMSRDKCGAAAAAGFMQVVNVLQPPTVKVVVALGVVRNSCGENAYVSDEVITARSGARVRVTNTDAEGRMAMADILYHVKEMALCSVNPHIFTIATLTGHAVKSAGSGYSIAMDNSVARSISNAYKLQACGEVMGDPFEVSVLRKDDFTNYKGKCEGDDVLQTQGRGASTAGQRGHQGACAFLVLASGLDKHGKASEKPLRYSHLDIAASAGDLPDAPTGAPILALANRFLTNEFKALKTEE